MCGYVRAEAGRPDIDGQIADSQRTQTNPGGRLFGHGSRRFSLNIAKISQNCPLWPPKDHMQSAILQMGRFLADGRGIGRRTDARESARTTYGGIIGKPEEESRMGESRGGGGPTRVHGTAGSSTVAWIPSSASCSCCMRLRLTLLAGLPLPV